MEEKEITPEQSLALIQTMISQAKNTVADNGFFIIFWGWFVFSAAMINYISLKLGISYGYYVWFLMPLGGLLFFIKDPRISGGKKVKTYTGDFLGFLWIGFSIAMVLALLMINTNGAKTTYFFLMLLYGLATFVSGGALKFRPLIYGSFFSFGAAIGAIFSEHDGQLLLWLAFALLFSYIVPGHLLRNKYKSQKHV